MILKNKVFCNENFSFMADGETFKDFAVLNVGVEDREDHTKERMVCAHLTMHEMKELRDYIDEILKTYKEKES